MTVTLHRHSWTGVIYHPALLTSVYTSVTACLIFRFCTCTHSEFHSYNRIYTHTHTSRMHHQSCSWGHQEFQHHTPSHAGYNPGNVWYGPISVGIINKRHQVLNSLWTCLRSSCDFWFVTIAYHLRPTWSQIRTFVACKLNIRKD